MDGKDEVEKMSTMKRSLSGKEGGHRPQSDGQIGDCDKTNTKVCSISVWSIEHVILAVEALPFAIATNLHYLLLVFFVDFLARLPLVPLAGARAEAEADAAAVV